MRNQSVLDERVIAQRRKICSEAYSILMIALLGSMLVQQFLLDAPFEQYAFEFICFTGVSFYIIIRYTMAGLNIYGDGKRAKIVPLLNSTVAGIVVTVITGVSNYTKYAGHYEDNGIGYFIATLVITFISAAGSAFVILSLFRYLSEKRQAKIQKRLDEEEKNE